LTCSGEQTPDKKKGGNTMKKQNKKQKNAESQSYKDNTSKLDELAIWDNPGNREKRAKIYNQLFPTDKETITLTKPVHFSFALQIVKIGDTAKWLGSYAEGKVSKMILKKTAGKEAGRKGEIVKVTGELDKSVQSIGKYNSKGEPVKC